MSSSGTSKSMKWRTSVSMYYEMESSQKKFILIQKQDFKKKIKQIINLNEQIICAWIFKNPLSESQLTSFLLYHSYLILRTQKWWWSIEKTFRGLYIQKCSQFQDVAYLYRDEKRYESDVWKPKSLQTAANLRVPIKYLIEKIYENELTDQYNVIQRNCQHFSIKIMAILENISAQYKKQIQKNEQKRRKKILKKEIFMSKSNDYLL